MGTAQQLGAGLGQDVLHNHQTSLATHCPRFHVVVSVCKAAPGWLHSHGAFILSFCVIILQEKCWELNAC